MNDERRTTERAAKRTRLANNERRHGQANGIDLKHEKKEMSVRGKRRTTNDERRGGQANGQNQGVV